MSYTENRHTHKSLKRFSHFHFRISCINECMYAPLSSISSVWFAFKSIIRETWNCDKARNVHIYTYGVFIRWLFKCEMENLRVCVIRYKVTTIRFLTAKKLGDFIRETHKMLNFICGLNIRHLTVFNLVRYC